MKLIDKTEHSEAYIARIIKSDDGWYAIDFPDLPGAHAQCRNFKNVRDEAEKSLYSFLSAMKSAGEEVPDASTSFELKAGEMAVSIAVRLEESE